MKNKLQMLIDLAKANEYLVQEYLKQHTSDISKDIQNDFLGVIPDGIEVCNENMQGYKSIELSGIATFFEYIHKLPNTKVVYENTIAMTLHGIDAITQDDNGMYTIYEIKGTARELKTPKSYLKRTKHKGRQLSWEWCWMSLVDMAEFPLTASVFLVELYEPVIHQRVKRKLVIVECSKCQDRSYIGENIHIFDYEELGIKEKYNLKNPKKMLEELV